MTISYWNVDYISSILFQLGLVVTVNSLGFENLIPSPGPFFMIFALVALYQGFIITSSAYYFLWLCDLPARIPKLSSRQLFLGLDFSEKSWVYLLALQLLFSEGVSSITAGALGTLAGYIYDTNSFGIQRFRLPAFLEVLLNPERMWLFIWNYLQRIPLALNGYIRSMVSTQGGPPQRRPANDVQWRPAPGRPGRGSEGFLPARRQPQAPSEEAVSTLMVRTIIFTCKFLMRGCPRVSDLIERLCCKL